jgi:hypothetical protein
LMGGQAAFADLHDEKTEEGKNGCHGKNSCGGKKTDKNSCSAKSDKNSCKGAKKDGANACSGANGCDGKTKK